VRKFSLYGYETLIRLLDKQYLSLSNIKNGVAFGNAISEAFFFSVNLNDF